MSQILFRNMSLLDPKWDEARGGYEVLVEGDTIREVSAKPIKSAKARVVDCGKRTLMPMPWLTPREAEQARVLSVSP